ncbi:MAG: hypothetical protein ABFD25_14295, partial [Clostridiaceae bacterium]
TLGAVGTYIAIPGVDVPEWTSCPFHRLFLFSFGHITKLFLTLISGFEGTDKQGASVLFVAVVFPTSKPFCLVLIQWYRLQRP